MMALYVVLESGASRLLEMQEASAFGGALKLAARFVAISKYRMDEGIGLLAEEANPWPSPYERKGVKLEEFRVVKKVARGEKELWESRVRLARENSSPHLTTYGIIKWLPDTPVGMKVVMPRYESRHPREEEVEEMEVGVLRGLRTMHRYGVQHADVRLPNVVKARNGGWVLIDYENGRKVTERGVRNDYRAAAGLMQFYMKRMVADRRLLGLYLRIACGDVADIERFIDEGCVF
jgi:hypothetical protein